MIWIAEAGSNHNGNFLRALELIKTAKTLGCWGIKFQLFSAETLYSQECPNDQKRAKQREFPLKWIPDLYDFCKQTGIKLGYSIFNEVFIDKVINYCDFLKISSWDVLRFDLIKKCWATGLPLIISLGGINENELKTILRMKPPTIYKKIMFMHCAPQYPSLPKNCNLNMIKTIKRLYCEIHGPECKNYIGWSDHTVEPGVIYQAITLGAQTIEFHLDLNDRCGTESVCGHVWAPHLIQNVIHNVSIGEEALGTDYININEKLFELERLWRADKDGLRPMKSVREKLKSNLL